MSPRWEDCGGGSLGKALGVTAGSLPLVVALAAELLGQFGDVLPRLQALSHQPGLARVQVNGEAGGVEVEVALLVVLAHAAALAGAQGLAAQVSAGRHIDDVVAQGPLHVVLQPQAHLLQWRLVSQPCTAEELGVPVGRDLMPSSALTLEVL